jgi:hypothetical protein
MIHILLDGRLDSIPNGLRWLPPDDADISGFMIVLGALRDLKETRFWSSRPVGILLPNEADYIELILLVPG